MDHVDQDPRFRTVYPGWNAALVTCLEWPHKSVLDVGCGCGGNAKFLAENGATVVGVTWNPEECKQAGRFCSKVYCHDLNDGLPAMGEIDCDLVVCSHVLEHIAYPGILLRDLSRVLRPGGRLFVIIPNLFFWQDRLKLIRGIWNYADSGTFDYTHLRWYTKDSLTHLVCSQGLILDYFRADGWIPLPGLKFIIGSKLRQKVNQLAGKWWPGLFGQQLIFAFRKRE